MASAFATIDHTSGSTPRTKCDDPTSTRSMTVATGRFECFSRHGLDRTYVCFSVGERYLCCMKPQVLVDRLTTADIDACTAAELPGLFALLRQLAGWASTIEASLARRAVELEASGHGVPAADAISRGTKTSRRKARQTEKRGETLAHAPTVEAQLSKGRISTEHADALANAAARLDGSQRDELFARDADLAVSAAGLTPGQFQRHLNRVVDEIAADDELERSEHQRTLVSLSHGLDAETGMGWIRADLHPDDYQRVKRRLDAETKVLKARLENEGRRHEQIAADALVSLATSTRATSTVPAEVMVLIDLTTLTTGRHADTISEYGDGNSAPVETIRRHACSANLIPAVLDGAGQPLDVGRAKRHATPAQRQALRTMYRTCAIGECDREFDHCHIHHLREWERDVGPTDLDNLLPLCSHHHHRAHEGRWQLQLDPSTRQLTTTLPNGQPHSTSRPDLLHDRAA
jgi:hypothetical protein